MPYLLATLLENVGERLLNFQCPTVSAVGLPYTSLPLDGGGGG